VPRAKIPAAAAPASNQPTHGIFAADETAVQTAPRACHIAHNLVAAVRPNIQ